MGLDVGLGTDVSMRDVRNDLWTEMGEKGET